MKTAPANADTGPVDTDTMRGNIARLVPHQTAQPPTGEQLATLTATLRGHVELMIPEVERLVARLPEDDIPRYCAQACVGEARRKLAGRTSSEVPVINARRLARVLSSLCDHYEALTGQGMCVACDRPLRATDETVPFGPGSGSGGTSTSHIHAGCAQRPRPAR
ncbi:DUF6415 family natural product biosynthesis protein [Streptomyces echinatus]|uniref:DUF6415 family natural product biosynthesis protein n=1 Tax=Streptomyces echinatus TaxID=67293 RepID=UPI0037F6F285